MRKATLSQRKTGAEPNQHCTSKEAVFNGSRMVEIRTVLHSSGERDQLWKTGGGVVSGRELRSPNNYGGQAYVSILISTYL